MGAEFAARFGLAVAGLPMQNANPCSNQAEAVRAHVSAQRLVGAIALCSQVKRCFIVSVTLDSCIAVLIIPGHIDVETEPGNAKAVQLRQRPIAGQALDGPKRRCTGPLLVRFTAPLSAAARHMGASSLAEAAAFLMRTGAGLTAALGACTKAAVASSAEATAWAASPSPSAASAPSSAPAITRE